MEEQTFTDQEIATAIKTVNDSDMLSGSFEIEDFDLTPFHNRNVNTGKNLQILKW